MFKLYFKIIFKKYLSNDIDAASGLVVAAAGHALLGSAPATSPASSSFVRHGLTQNTNNFKQYFFKKNTSLPDGALREPQ